MSRQMVQHGSRVVGGWQLSQHTSISGCPSSSSKRLRLLEVVRLDAGTRFGLRAVGSMFLIPSDFVVHSFRPPMEEAMRRLWSQLG